MSSRATNQRPHVIRLHSRLMRVYLAMLLWSSTNPLDKLMQALAPSTTAVYPITVGSTSNQFSQERNLRATIPVPFGDGQYGTFTVPIFETEVASALRKSKSSNPGLIGKQAGILPAWRRTREFAPQS